MLWQITINSLIAGSIYALMAVSFSLIYSNSKFFNMAHGIMATVGGYAVFYFTKTLGWNIYLSVIFGIIFAGLAGYTLNYTVFEKLKKKKSTNTALLVASLGALTIIQALVAIIFTNQFQTISNNETLERIYSIGGAVITQTQIIILSCALIIFLCIIGVQKYTKFGKMMRAISDDEEVAAIVGINTPQVIRKVFFVGSAIAGLAGILYGFDTGIEPTMGMGLFLKGVIAAIIGGTNSVPGAFLGAYLIGFAENFGIWKISGEWKDAIAFVVLIIFLLIRPKGIVKR